MNDNTLTHTPQLNKPQKRQRGVLRFYPKSVIMLTLLLFLCFIEYRFATTYIDEVCAAAAFVILPLFVSKYTRRDSITFILIVFSIVIGLLGNLIYGLVPSWLSVGVDVLSQLKMPLAFFTVKYALNEKEKQATIEMLLPIAKVYVVVNAILALVSQVAPTGLTGQVRYGLKSYKFVFLFTQQYATVTFVMIGAIICSQTLPKRKRNLYLFFGIIAAVATLKSFSLTFTAVFVLLYFFFKRNSKINLPIILILVVVGLYLGSYQINTYLLNENAPRRVFFHYAIIDANDHFPLGSGFATFGSSEAQKNYSPLYYEYGFQNRWGMSPEKRAFLVDTYWPTVIGQLGWFGAATYIAMYVRIFQNFSIASNSINRKAFLYAFFAQYMVHAIGSAILQSSAGFLGFMMLSLCTVVDKEAENTASKRKFHIRL